MAVLLVAIGLLSIGIACILVAAIVDIVRSRRDRIERAARSDDAERDS